MLPQTVKIILTLEGSAQVNDGKELPFKRETTVTLTVSGDESRDALSEAILDEVKKDLANVLQDAVDDASRGYSTRTR